MYKVGLTGGIACGKSTVTELFKQLGVTIIDADEIAHALVVPKQAALNLISQHFGTAVILEDGTLNRPALANIIFNDIAKKQQLEAIMHPLIYAEIKYQLSLIKQAYCMIAIPLLIETKMQSLVDHILVIDCPREMQINRVKSRDQLNEQQIIARLNNQASRTERLAAADSIIDNSQSVAYLEQQVQHLHHQFLKQTK